MTFSSSLVSCEFLFEHTTGHTPQDCTWDYFYESSGLFMEELPCVGVPQGQGSGAAILLDSVLDVVLLLKVFLRTSRIMVRLPLQQLNLLFDSLFLSFSITGHLVWKSLVASHQFMALPRFFGTSHVCQVYIFKLSSLREVWRDTVKLL